MILIIDNYDSFTWNLVHFLGEIGASCDVRRNDAFSCDEVRALKPDAIIFSPGPCDPDRAGISLDIVAQAGADIAMLGVCLGHEVIGQAFGGDIIRVPPVHGKLSRIRHDNQGIFNGLQQNFEAARYHSLVIDETRLPDCLEACAWTENGLLMGVRHKDYNIHGVQFHPESIATQYGHALLKNFLSVSGYKNE